MIVEVGPVSRTEGDSGLTRAHSWTAFETWLSVLNHLDRVYVSGQDRVEVFWRTMCMDCDLGAADGLRPSGRLSRPFATPSENAFFTGQPLHSEKETSRTKASSKS